MKTASSLKKRKIQLVIFDLDGTLMDAYGPVARSINYTMKKMGLPLMGHKTIRKNVGWGVKHLVANFVGPEKIDKAITIYRRHHKESLKRGTKLLAGAKRLLTYLKKNEYKIAVASNRPQRFSMIAIKHLRIDKYFDYVLCADRVKRPKPYPDILKDILKKFSLKKDQALYIGDMTVDMETGKRAGVKTIAVVGGSSTKKEIQKFKPFRIVSHVYEVASIVKAFG